MAVTVSGSALHKESGEAGKLLDTLPLQLPTNIWAVSSVSENALAAGMLVLFLRGCCRAAGSSAYLPLTGHKYSSSCNLKPHLSNTKSPCCQDNSVISQD